MKAKIEWSDNRYKGGEITLLQDPHRYVPVFTVTVLTDNEQRVKRQYHIYLKGLTGEIILEERKKHG